MSNTLFVYKSALEDIQKAMDWYESQRGGLETHFHQALTLRLKFITDNPEAAAIRLEGFRSIQLKKFPYSVYYEFDDTNATVRVVAVLHDKRDRKILQKRP
jgi:toxin ParE1/3/4